MYAEMIILISLVLPDILNGNRNSLRPLTNCTMHKYVMVALTVSKVDYNRNNKQYCNRRIYPFDPKIEGKLHFISYMFILTVNRTLKNIIILRFLLRKIP